MKTAGRLLGRLLVVLLLLLLALQAALTFGLKPVLERAVLPELERQLEARIGLGGIRANLFRGSARVRALTLDDFESSDDDVSVSIPDCRFNLRLLSLPSGVVQLSDLRAREVMIDIVRNAPAATARRNGDPTGGSGEGGRAPQPRSGDTATPSSGDLPRLVVGHGSVEGRVQYVDHGTPGEPLSLAMDLSLETEGLTTFETAGRKAGTFSVRGHLADQPGKFITSFDGSVSPLLDPKKPTLQLKGDVRTIDLNEIGDLAQQLEVRSDSIDLRARIQCRHGSFERGNSVVIVTLFNPRLTGELRRKARRFRLPPVLTVPVPLRGTLDKPVLHWENALIRALLESSAGNVGAILNAAGVDDEKLEKKLGKGLEKLGITPDQIDETVADGLKKLGEALNLGD